MIIKRWPSRVQRRSPQVTKSGWSTNARNFLTPYRQVSDLMDRIMCPPLPNARHVLINPLAAEALHARKGLDGTVVPDGFDFDRDVPPIDELAFRSKLQVLAGDPRPVGAS